MAKVEQVAKLQDEKLIFDANAFDIILREAKATKNLVTVISVCGESGREKSYLPNLLLQYLSADRHERQEPEAWVQDVNGDSVGTDEPGIYLYRDIFVVDEVSVLIMQAQGGFANDRDRKVNTQIFALATLLSTVQIFNLKTHLRGNDVILVKNLVEFVSKVGTEVGVRGMWDTRVQFLVQGWPYPNDHAFGLRGGKDYLHHALESSKFEESSESMYLHSHLTQHYKSVECFLMPHMGLKIRSQSNVKVKDIEPSFLKHLQILAENLFDSTSLFPKMVGKKELNAKSLVTYSKTLVKEIVKQMNYKEVENLRKAPPIPVKRNIRPPQKRPKKYLEPEKITEHGPVTVVEIERGNVVLNEDALERILSQPEIGNRPISLISIAGTFRKGKSFIMNFFLRYMRRKGYECDNDDWLGGKDAPLKDGFEWQSGVDPHTKGIVLFSEPFLVQTEKGEVAVLFMDTQGLFDANIDKEKNLMIFAFNAIISSVQLLNISMNIEESHLDFLQFFTEYARTVKGASSGAPFLQSLKFLIRDWQFTNDYSHGHDGGKAYLRSYLDRSGRSQELAAVRAYIRSSFSDISCFLMPHPGFKLTRLKHGEGCLDDLEADFVHQLTPLVRSVLHPDNLVVKEFRGKPLNARGVMVTAVKCAEAFASGKLPKVSSVMDIIADAGNNEMRKECLDYYTDLMKKRVEAHPSEENLKEIHIEVKEAALREYFSGSIFGGAEKQSASKAHVEKEIDNAYLRFAAKIDHTEAKDKVDVSTHHLNAISEYKTMMQKVMQEPVSPEEFNRFHEECWEEAKEKLENATMRRPSLRQETMQQMEEEKKYFYAHYRKQNEKTYEAAIDTLQTPDYFEMVSHEEKTEGNSQSATSTEECLPDEQENNLREVISHVVQKHQEKVKELGDVNEETLREEKKNLYASARHEYNRSNCKGVFDRYLKLLENEISKTEIPPPKPDRVAILSRNLRRLVAECQKHFEAQCKRITSVYVKREILENLLAKMKDSEVETYNVRAEEIRRTSSEKFEAFLKAHLDDLEAALDEKIRVVKKENVRNCGHLKLAEAEMQMRVVKQYHSSMDLILKSGYIPAKKLYLSHDTIRAYLSGEIDSRKLPFYVEEGKSKADDEAFRGFKEDVLRMVDGLFEEKKKWNKQNHGVIVRALGNFLNK